MKRLIASLSLLMLLCMGQAAYSQDFSNKGKEFWIAYSYHVGMSGGGNPTMTLYLTSDVTTTYNVDIYGVGTLASGSIVAGAVVNVNVPISYAINGEGSFSQKAVHVTSASPIVVYAYITRSAASAATLCLPVAVLGKEYVASSFTQVSNEANSNSFVTVVGVEDNTTVEIRPSANTKNGWLAGQTYQVTLNKGQVYQILGFANASQSSAQTFLGNDLSGTWVRSVSTGTGGCKRIAVFSGSGKIRLPNGNCANSSDNLYQQLYPTGTWGKKYLSVPSNNNNYNYYRVYRKDPSTQLRVNGVLVPPSSFTNDYYELPGSNNTPNLFEADQPISVAQYFTTQGCGGNSASVPNDPDMIMLNPVEQNINKVTLVSSNLAAAETPQYPHQHHIHVIMKNTGTGISSFLFDGTPVDPASWIVHPRDPSYSYVYLKDRGATTGVRQGFHTLSSDSGFLALAYGYAAAESYGYSAGANVKDLYQFASIHNDYATVNFPATCRNTPFRFSMTFPYQPTQITWEFNGLFTNVVINNPVPDSTYQVGGKTVYRFTLPNTYSAPTVGTYPIRILATGATADGCGGEQEISYDLQVLDRPLANFSFTSSGCVTDPVQFTDASNGQGRPFGQFNWFFGNTGNTSTVQNPTYTFPGAGNYQVKHLVITDIGCVSDTASQTVSLSQPPVANFGISEPYCVGKSLRFTDTSIANGGTLSNWQWNFGDGTPVVNAPSGAAQTHTYATAGTFTISLQVSASGGCKSLVFSRTIVIGNNPLAGFTFGNACLPTGAVTFTNSSTIAGGGVLTYQWNFGPAGASSTATSPTYNYGAAGPFNASLVALAANGCTDTARQVVNTIFARPTSSFTLQTAPVAGKYCRNANITMTSNAGAPGSTVSEYHWDFGDGNSSTQQAPVKSYTTPGTFVVKHWIKSALGCESDTTEQTITIVALPRASFTVGAHRCAGDPIDLISNSDAIAPGSNISAYSWTVNTAPLAGPQAAQMALTPASAVDQTVLLTVQTEAGCTDDTTILVSVHPKPVPDFNLPNVCLPVGAATFTNATTIADGSIATVTYQWSFGDGGIATTTNPSHNFSSTGPFAISLTATSANGCEAVAVKQLTTVFAQPQAQFTASSSDACLGTALTFTDASTAPASSVAQWNWDFGDGNNSSIQNPTHTYANPGTYQVTLIVTSAAGCVSAATPQTVTVNRLPTAQFTIGAPMCVTRDVTFTDASAANSGTLQSWTWDFGDGSITVNGQGPQRHTYAATGNYGVHLTVTNDKGCTASIIDTVRVHPLPLAGFVIPENCLSDPFSEFTDTSRVAAPDAISAWSWNFGDAGSMPATNVSNQQNPRHRFSAVGPFSVSLTATTNNGCTDVITQQVMIAGTSPVPVLTVLQGNVCSNDSVRIKDSSWVDIGRILRIDIWWDASDPSSVQTVLNPTAATFYSHKYPELFNPATRTMNIKLVAYSGTTCAVDATQPLTLLAVPEVRFAPVTGVCENVPAFTITEATWGNQTTVPGTAVFSGSGVSAAGLFTPTTAGIGLHPINFTVTGNNGCVNDTSMSIAVYGVPTVTAGPDKFILEGGVDTLGGSGTGNSLQFVWTPARWLSDDSTDRPAVRPLGDETYTLTVTSADGCTNADQVVVKMLKMPTIPNVFTPNGDGVNDRWVIQYLESYPGATVDIFNRYGQPVFHSVNYSTAWDGTLKDQPLPTGTYYYIINPKNGRPQMAGFVDLIR
ncbi:MAG: PKD domain-containing protein [Chitinophagaceae bacterium]|nr:MAG: PKD domain-containing protein [Chitinophagaceae bacterium]